jgi:hypothetical protein
MSKRLHILISQIAAMVAILAMGMAAPARADLEIILQEAGQTSQYFSVATVNATGILTPTSPVNFGDFTITVLASSQTNGSTSDLETTNLTITNNTGTGHVLTILSYGNNFTLPSGSNLLMTSSAGGNVIAGTPADTNMTHQGWINNANPLIDAPPSGSNPGLVPPMQTTPGPQPSVFNVLSFDNGTLTVPFNRTGSLFSLTSEAVVNVGANDKLHFTQTLSVTSAVVPEPSTMALAGLGALGLIGYGLRRRKALGA